MTIKNLFSKIGGAGSQSGAMPVENSMAGKPNHPRSRSYLPSFLSLPSVPVPRGLRTSPARSKLLATLCVGLLPLSLNATTLFSEASIDNAFASARDENTGTTGASASTNTEVNGLTVTAASDVTTGYGVTSYSLSFAKNKSPNGLGTDLTGSSLANSRFTDTLTVNPVGGSFSSGDNLTLQFAISLTGSGSLESYDGTSSSFDIFNSAAFGRIDGGSDITLRSLSANGFFNTLSDGTLVGGNGTTGSASGLGSISNYSAGSTIEIFGEVNSFVDIDRSSSGQNVGGSIISDYTAVFQLSGVLKDGNPLTEGSFTVLSGSGTDYLTVPEPSVISYLLMLALLPLLFRLKRRRS